jgi:leucine dehydrogenase
MQAAHFSETFEGVHEIEDKSVGLSGMIAIHSLRLGPAAGGCRMWSYRDNASLRADAVRLAEGMAHKNALADLPFGGGKAVLRRPDGDFDRQRYFEAFGRAVEALRGDYVTAEDVGTTVADMTAVSRSTRHVAGLPTSAGSVGGDPSPWTALGVFLAMKVAVERHLDRPLTGVSVAVQGLGSVGYALSEMLHRAGARLIVSEPRPEIAQKAISRFGATNVTPNLLMTIPVDVFAPCALGGVLDEKSIGQLKAKVVCGAANNQLATPEDGARLAELGVLYAPDYLVNAGGIINVAAEHFRWSQEEAVGRIEAIPGRLIALLDESERLGLATNMAADAMARQIIDAGPKVLQPSAAVSPIAVR